MRVAFHLFILMLFCGSASAQSGYWQQDLRYTIKAELSEADQSIRASETIVYKNNSPTTLPFIWFHLWPNAYSNDQTALIRQIKSPHKAPPHKSFIYNHYTIFIKKRKLFFFYF